MVWSLSAANKDDDGIETYEEDEFVPAVEMSPWDLNDNGGSVQIVGPEGPEEQKLAA